MATEVTAAPKVWHGRFYEDFDAGDVFPSRFGRTVTDSASSACVTATDPKLSVTRTCPPLPVLLGQPLVFSGVVSNAGNITLVNVTIVNTQPTAGSPVWGPITLAPGESVTYYGS